MAGGVAHPGSESRHPAPHRPQAAGRRQVSVREPASRRRDGRRRRPRTRRIVWRGGVWQPLISRMTQTNAGSRIDIAGSPYPEAAGGAAAESFVALSGLERTSALVVLARDVRDERRFLSFAYALWTWCRLVREEWPLPAGTPGRNPLVGEKPCPRAPLPKGERPRIAVSARFGPIRVRHIGGTASGSGKPQERPRRWLTGRSAASPTRRRDAEPSRR